MWARCCEFLFWNWNGNIMFHFIFLWNGEEKEEKKSNVASQWCGCLLMLVSLLYMIMFLFNGIPWSAWSICCFGFVCGLLDKFACFILSRYLIGFIIDQNLVIIDNWICFFLVLLKSWKINEVLMGPSMFDIMKYHAEGSCVTIWSFNII